MALEGFNAAIQRQVANRTATNKRLAETISQGMFSLSDGAFGSRSQASLEQEKQGIVASVQQSIAAAMQSGDDNAVFEAIKRGSLKLQTVDPGAATQLMDWYTQFQPTASADRKIILQGGVQYWADTGLPVLNVPIQRQIEELGDKRKYYINPDGTLELVKPDLVIPETPESLATEIITNFGYADTLEQMEELVKNLIDNGLAGTEIYKTAIANLNVEKGIRSNEKEGIRADQIKLSNRVSGTHIPAFESTLQSAEALIEEYSGRDIPGIGFGGLAVTEAASYAQSVKQALMNVILKARSGAAVTETEFDRLQTEVAGVKAKYLGIITDKDFKKWVKALRDIQNREIDAIFGGYRPEVKQAYWDQGGFKPIVKPGDLYNLED